MGLPCFFKDEASIVIPLFYFIGACQRPTLLYDGFEMGNLSLLSFGCIN
jgi:hypothetical protein